ncbi:hypothetical protein F0562_031810 [Nyssa sinensis]|uniref:PCI domain-containing protein n=1 Tax=Nyssa sinensis TaxID=561372 RepID=A0A5J5ATJ7_9ASTE|nr:hypothetical protein F0562_031810 [Nyssa sinensis]
MNQGGSADTITTLDPNLLEVADSNQGSASSYYTPSGSEAVPWGMHRADNCSTENGILSSSSYHHNQLPEPPSRNIQDGLNVTSVSSTSSLGATNVPQEYNGFASYPNTNPYGYSNTGYAGYYNGYQHQSNQSYPPPVGAYQSTDIWKLYEWRLHSSTAAATSLQYQQHYKQWADYYSQTEVSCAPGTEKISVSTSNPGGPLPGVTTGYSASFSQPPAPFIPSWRPETSSSQLPSVQPGAVISGVHDGYWKHGAPVFQNHNASLQQPQFQKHMDSNPTYEGFQDQQKTACPQGSNIQYPAAHQVPQSYQSSLPTVPQTVTPLDSRRVSKLQIPTNPRIASNLAFGLPKTDKDSSTTSTAAKPAYISVSLPKPNDKVLSHDAADSILKPGVFPKSLRGYVERALTRCKDDTQMAACQDVMKEVITKATADGTLYTRDWDTEPLFPLPNVDVANKDGLPVSNSCFFIVEEQKKPNEEKFSGGKLEKDYSLNSLKFSLSEQRNTNKNSPRPVKRQRFAEGPDAADNGDASSDSDKEQSLTAYYSGAIALANSPEERKRRENRSKRFEKMVVAGLLKILIGMRLLSRGPVRKLRNAIYALHSAPDPATVRPEEVLEKALVMVQNSQKNYLYKCDQLKSIRQDLTVQHIRNELTVKVYETHARLAIEVGDLPEYNQCQSQLTTLYAEGIKGCHMEFSAYNLLCVILHSNNNRDLLSAMSRLSVATRKDEAVKHALAVRAAVTSGNYVLFFRLYKTAPNLNTLLMDLYVEKMRYTAVRSMSRSYRPTVPVSYIAQVLGFINVLPRSETGDEKDTDGLEECVEWLKAHGACLIADNTGEMQLDSKNSASSLYMPEPEDAVAHGDASLAVNDFFTRTSS